MPRRQDNLSARTEFVPYITTFFETVLAVNGKVKRRFGHEGDSPPFETERLAGMVGR